MEEANKQPHTEDNKQSAKLRLLSESMLLALSSAAAYLFAFYYERGYTAYFGIPESFIDVSLTSILIFTAGVVSLFYISFAFFDVLFPFIRPKHPYLSRYVPLLAVLFFMGVFLPLAILKPKEKWMWLLFIGVWCAFAALLLLLPLIIHRESGGWKERYDAELERHINESKENMAAGGNFHTFLARRLGYRYVGLVILGFYLSTIFVGAAGETQAEQETTFLLTNTIPEMAVLRVYGEHMICAPIDRNAHEVKKSFSMIKVADDPKLILKLEKVGPLKPVEKLSSENPQPTATPSPTP